jgi:hypothetical protein
MRWISFCGTAQGWILTLLVPWQIFGFLVVTEDIELFHLSGIIVRCSNVKRHLSNIPRHHPYLRIWRCAHIRQAFGAQSLPSYRGPRVLVLSSIEEDFKPSAYNLCGLKNREYSSIWGMILKYWNIAVRSCMMFVLHNLYVKLFARWWSRLHCMLMISWLQMVSTWMRKYNRLFSLYRLFSHSAHQHTAVIKFCVQGRYSRSFQSMIINT